MRICAIGDSHIAALMLGWKLIQEEYPQTRITFFGAPVDTLKDLSPSGGVLIATSAELRQSMEKADPRGEISGDYNAYLLCGLRFNHLRLRWFCRSWRAEAHAKDKRAPLSDVCFARSIESSLRGTLAIDTVAKLRQITSAPIWLVPSPLPSAELSERGWMARIARRGEDRSVADFFDAAASKVAEDLGVRLALQPAATKAGPLFTKSSYSRGSVKLRRDLAKEHHDGEVYHMNAEYGAEVLRAALACMSEAETALESQESR